LLIFFQPDITFFGEGLPQEFFDRLRAHDRDKVDLVIVIGTSMKVAPVSEVPQIIPPEVPQIYISRDVSTNTSSGSRFKFNRILSQSTTSISILTCSAIAMPLSGSSVDGLDGN